MASQTTCICSVEMPRPFRKERAALAPSTSKRFSAVKRSVKPRSCRIVATANNSASGARSTLSESNTPNSQERITWLKRNGSDALRDKSIASRTRTVSGTLIPAKTIPYLPRSMLLWGRFCRGSCALVFKPLAERFDLLLRIRRGQVRKAYLGRRNQNRFRVRESVKPGLAIVVTHTGISDPAKGHGFDKQVNVYLIDRAAAEGQACEEVIDRLLISAEEEAGKRLRMLLHLANGHIHVLVGEDGKKRPKDLVLHDRIVPSHWIDDRGIEIACLRVGGPAYDDFFLIDEARQAFGGLWADHAGIVVGPALRVGTVQLNHSFLALCNELLCNGFVHVGVAGRGAPLAAPSRRTPDDLLGCIRNICGRVNESRILPA